MRFNCELFTRPVRAVHLAAAAETRPENSANIFGVLRVLCVCGIERSKKQQQWWCRAKRTQQRRKIHFYSTRFADGSEFLRSSFDALHCPGQQPSSPSLPADSRICIHRSFALDTAVGCVSFAKHTPSHCGQTDQRQREKEREKEKHAAVR